MKTYQPSFKKSSHPNQRTPVRSITTLMRALGAGLAAAASLAACADGASGPTISCGPGTTLAPATGQCVPSGDFNVIVDDFVVGEFEMSNVDVPEQLTAGIADTRRFTIKNAGDDDRAVVNIRVGLAPVEADIAELRAALETVDADGLPGAVMVGQIVLDDLKAGESRDVAIDYFVPVGVEDGLYGVFYAVDEVPLVKGEDGNYAIDRTAPAVTEAEEGDSPLPEAAHVFAPATVIVGTPTAPNLRILSAKLDNGSFELDFTERGDDPTLTLQARLSSQALDLTEEITATFELALPGHVVDVPGQDLGREAFASDEAFAAAPAETTYRYDADRSFELFMQNPSGFESARVYSPACGIEEALDEAGEVTQIERCATIFTETSLDDNFQLGLSNADLRLLELTQALASLNPDLDANGEIAGTVTMRVTTPQAEYEGNVTDNVTTLPVVFMAPEPGDLASEDDKDADDGETSDKANGAGPYNVITKKKLTENLYGNEWVNANFSFDSQASRNELGGVSVGNYAKEAHRAGLVLMKKPFTLASISGLSDTGSVLLGKDAKAATGLNLDMETEITVFNVKVLDWIAEEGWCKTTNGVTVCPLAEFGTNACNSGVDGVQSTRCYEQARERNKGKTKTTENYTTAATRNPGTGPGGKAPPVKKGGRALRYTYSYTFLAGPVPLKFSVDAGLSLGGSIIAELVIDRSQGLVPAVGGQFGIGLYAGLDVNLFAGIDLGVGRVGVEGSLNLIRLDAVPAVFMTVSGIRDTDAGCWKIADSELGTTGTITVTGPSGEIGFGLYAGRQVCFFGKCLDLEVKIFSFTFAKFDLGWTKPWVLWDKSKTWVRRAGQPGVCADGTPGQTVQWSSPDSCTSAKTGEAGYCSSTSTNAVAGPYSPSRVLGAYKTTYTVPSGFSCATMQVNANSSPAMRRGTDFYRIYDANGAMIHQETGGFNVGRYKVCSPSVTVALEAGANVPSGEYGGITVFFEPAN
jgi:hypothetical protein